MQDLLLAAGAHRNGLLAPICDSGLLLAEHALAGARRIDQDLIKPAGEALGELLGVLVEHECVCDAEPLNVARENTGALGVDLVADEQPLAAQCGGKLRAFSARRGTQIEHTLAGMDV